MAEAYDVWLDEVQAALESLNMPMDDWQGRWPFDFAREYRAGVSPADAAESANRYWWREQNKAVGQECQRTPQCWLSKGHQGRCEAISEGAI